MRLEQWIASKMPGLGNSCGNRGSALASSVEEFICKVEAVRGDGQKMWRDSSSRDCPHTFAITFAMIAAGEVSE